MQQLFHQIAEVKVLVRRWKIFLSFKKTCAAAVYHSNDSNQCPILAADFVIYYYGIENEQAIQAGAGSE